MDREIFWSREGCGSRRSRDTMSRVVEVRFRIAQEQRTTASDSDVRQATRPRCLSLAARSRKSWAPKNCEAATTRLRPALHIRFEFILQPAANVSIASQLPSSSITHTHTRHVLTNCILSYHIRSRILQCRTTKTIHSFRGVAVSSTTVAMKPHLDTYRAEMPTSAISRAAKAKICASHLTHATTPSLG